MSARGPTCRGIVSPGGKVAILENHYGRPVRLGSGVARSRRLAVVARIFVVSATSKMMATRAPAPGPATTSTIRVFFAGMAFIRILLNET
ncbi:dynein, 70 kDa intermediate chain, flagellar outer arm-like [Sesbania bispinosa]|nr:dynein, 70 kDa intermediate chain, flagellar outer arm-like [Sesbania bispinosa]